MASERASRMASPPELRGVPWAPPDRRVLACTASLVTNDILTIIQTILDRKRIYVNTTFAVLVITPRALNAISMVEGN